MWEIILKMMAVNHRVAGLIKEQGGSFFGIIILNSVDSGGS